MKRRLLWIAPLAVIGMALFLALGGWAVQSLWNWLLPGLFGWPVITFWQALGLLALCRILFGNIGMAGGRRGGRRGGVVEHWSALTPEEKERVRVRMRATFGFGSGPDASV